MRRVFGVMARAMASGFTTNSSSARETTGTGLAPASLAISE
jgi:hypothetical protein